MLAQKDITKFMGIPVDGFKKDMIQKLKAKGFEYDNEIDLLTGEFNSEKVNIFVATQSNKVWRIVVADAIERNEHDIKIRFNNLYDQFNDNPKYVPKLEDNDYISTSNPQPIGFSGILLAKRQNSFYCTYFLHNRNVADTKSPYPIKRLEVIRWFNQKSMVFNQSLS